MESSARKPFELSIIICLIIFSLLLAITAFIDIRLLWEYYEYALFYVAEYSALLIGIYSCVASFYGLWFYLKNKGSIHNLISWYFGVYAFMYFSMIIFCCVGYGGAYYTLQTIFYAFAAALFSVGLILSHSENESLKSKVWILNISGSTCMMISDLYILFYSFSHRVFGWSSIVSKLLIIAIFVLYYVSIGLSKKSNNKTRVEYVNAEFVIKNKYDDIKELKALLDSGAITQAQYDKKVEEILNQ